MMKYTHPLKDKSDDLPVTMIPPILFTDAVNGNCSKKWAMLLAGLPSEENAKLHNIHLMACSIEQGKSSGIGNSNSSGFGEAGGRSDHVQCSPQIKCGSGSFSTASRIP